MKVFIQGLFAIISLILISGSAGAITLSCNTCADCSSKIASASSGDTIQLANNLATPGTCINFAGKDNITFDCQGRIIDGDDSGSDYGIWLDDLSGGSNNNTISNCVLTDFYWGVYVYGSSNNTLKNITLDSNFDGILIRSNSNYNNFTNLTAKNNTEYGLYITSSSNYNNFSEINSKNNSFGLFIESSFNNTFRDVNITTYSNRGGLMVDISTVYNINDIDNSVIVDGTPVQFFDGYYKACPNNQILDYNDMYSQITFLGCLNVTLRATNVTDGVRMAYTNNSRFFNINSSYSYHGFYMRSSSNNTFTNITAISNFKAGLIASSSDRNTFTNTVSMNAEDGISLSDSNNNTFNNAITNFNSNMGFYMSSGFYNTLKNITMSSNFYGMYLPLISNNSFTELVVSNNQRGILIRSLSRYNIINNSRIYNNSFQGVYLWSFGASLTYNSFYNNYLNNTVNLYSDNANNLNYWNTTLSCTSGPNIIGGPCTGGNYWTDTDSNGNFSDSCIDSDVDGICQSSYTPQTNNIDFLPLAEDPPQLGYSSTIPPNQSTTGNNWIFVNVSANESLSWCTLDWNGVNQTMTATGQYCYRNMTSLSSGSYYFRTYGNDSTGHMNVTANWLIIVNAIMPPPSIYYVKFSVQNIHIYMGDNYLAKVYVKNPELTYHTFNITLGGDYPASLARFWTEPGADFNPDRRQLTVSLNPKEERVFTIEILPTIPKDGGYSLAVESFYVIPPGPALGSDTMRIDADYSPSFPGLEPLGILAILAFAGLAYWRMRLPGAKK